MSPIRPAPSCPARRVLLVATLALLTALPAWAQEGGTGPGSGLSPAERETQRRTLKQLQRDLLMQGARGRMAAARARQRELRKHGATRGQGLHARKAEVSDEGGKPLDFDRRVVMASAEKAVVAPTNVRVNNPTGDASSAGQAEESVAALGNYVLIAWNDGQGFTFNPYHDLQTAGYSVDGGASFTQVTIPHPSAYPNWWWSSDPIVTVDEKRGKFYYCGMGQDVPGPTAPSVSALAVVPATFSGSTFTWGTPSIVATVPAATSFLDKPWCVADSVTGNVYVTTTTFDASDHITFYRSTNQAVTWSPGVQISSVAENGTVQGSRPVVGPGGEIYVVWSAIGPFDADYLNLRKAPNPGSGSPSWGTEVTVDSLYAQFGTGAPGFNRERGITFPSIAVDRTKGANRGRVYVAWNETWDIISAPVPLNSGKAEVEPNGDPTTATPFTPGQTLRGSSSSTSDLDYWSFALSAGQSIIVWADSLPPSATYTLRLFAPSPDAGQRLCYGGDITAGSSVTQTYYMFTAPAAGTYYLRYAPVFGNSPIGSYRVRTAYGGGPGGYRARDQRDAFVKYSDNGTSWNGPLRLNDDGIGFDDFLPEVIVGADGCPYATWFDFRDDTYGSRANQYASRSQDGGATWQANARFTSATSNFTTSLSNIAPNQGDYSHLYGDPRYVRPTWADGRGANVDVWATAVDTWFALASCPPAQSANPRDVLNLTWTVNNQNPLFPSDYGYTLTSARAWPLPPPGTLPGVAAAGSGDLNLAVSVPDSVALGTNTLTLTVTNARGTRVQQCDVTVNLVTTLLAVEPTGYGLSFSPARPNPASREARLDFTLPGPGRVRLAIFGVQGEIVRTLVDGERPAGSNSVAWDGRDDSGRAVATGAYFARLEAAGRTLTRRIVWMR